MTIEIKYQTTKRVTCSLDWDTVNEIIAEHISKETAHKVKPDDVQWPHLFDGSRPEARVTYEFVEDNKT